MDRAVRFGHRLEMFTARPPAAAGGEVIQRGGGKESEEEQGKRKRPSRRSKKKVTSHVESDESGDESGNEGDDESDDNYYEAPPRKGSKKQDPNSKMNETTYKKTKTGFEYETVGGSKHVESFDPKRLVRTTKTTGLKVVGPQFRNNALRDDVKLQVFNPYNLSQGQSNLNQLVVSHNSPSWGGMRAGGKYGNSSQTSGKFNSLVESKERTWREGLQNSNQPFDYETLTQYEKIEDNPRLEEIAKLMTNPKWQNPNRIKKRFDNILQLDPDAMRVGSETRTLSGSKRQRTTTLGSDLHYGIPRRAYETGAHEKYLEAREEDSQSSDEELEPPKTKKRKKK
jgi:hypothetical protein